MRALETHSAAFFVNCNGGIGDGTDQRLLSRFHVSLDLSEPTTALRETIWQKCLESHKDIKFFVDRKTLAKWPLNGRDISNAVTTARTLVRNGTLNMEHLKRVVPAHKQRAYETRANEAIYELVPSSKPTHKKKDKKFVKIANIKTSRDLANSDTDEVEDRKDWDSNRRMTRSLSATGSSASSDLRREQNAEANKTQTFRECRASNPVGMDAFKRYNAQSLPPPLLPVSRERNRPHTNSWFFGPSPLPRAISPPYPPPPPAINSECQSFKETWGFRPPPPFSVITPPHPPSPRLTTREQTQADAKAWASGAVEDEYVWGSFGIEKSKKASQTSAKESDVSEVADSPPMPAINDSWGDWGSAQKDKKSPQVKLPSRPVNTNHERSIAGKEPSAMPDANFDWTSFGRKKDKKAKRPTAKEPEPSSPGATHSATQPILPPVEVDDWDSWLTSKNTDKGKKPRVIEQPLEDTPSPSERALPSTEAIPNERPKASSRPSKPHNPRLCIECYANRPVPHGMFCFECAPLPPKLENVITTRDLLPRRTAAEKKRCLSCGRDADLGDELACNDCQELYG